MRLYDLHVPFFIPRWRRVAVVAAALGWALFELVDGQVFWAILFGALGIHALYSLFVTFDAEVIRRKKQQ